MTIPKAILLNAISIIVLVQHSNNAPKTAIMKRDKLYIYYSYADSDILDIGVAKGRVEKL